MYKIMNQMVKEHISQLSTDEKILLVEEIWDSVAAEQENVSIPDFHKEILEERLKTLEEDKKTAKTWDEIKLNYPENE